MITKQDLIHSSSAGYTILPNDLFQLDLKPDLFSLLMFIAKWDGQLNKPMSSSFLAAGIKVSRAHVIKLKLQLVKADIIIETSLGKRKPNTYRVNWSKIKELTC